MNAMNTRNEYQPIVAVPDDNVVLSLRFLQFAVVIGFKLHQRSKDVLILVSVFISQQHLSG